MNSILKLLKGHRSKLVQVTQRALFIHTPTHVLFPISDNEISCISLLTEYSSSSQHQHGCGLIAVIHTRPLLDHSHLA